MVSADHVCDPGAPTRLSLIYGSIAEMVLAMQWSNKSLKKICKLCGKEFETVLYGEKRTYCLSCSPPHSPNVISILRRKARELGVEKLGGKCRRCGTDKPYLLDFHHRNPEEKEGSLSEFSKGYNLDKFNKELSKCDLLCANCHREFHYLHTLNGLSYEDFLNT